MDISKKDLRWYQDAIEKLSPLRFYLNEVLERIDSHNRFAKTVDDLTGDKSYYIRSSIFEEARKTLNKAEEFFSKSKKVKKGEVKCGL